MCGCSVYVSAFFFFSSRRRHTRCSRDWSSDVCSSQQPVLTVKVGQTIAAMYIGFASDVLPPNKITDYLIRVVQPKLQAVEGVQSADILGGKLFAMRAWLDPDKLAAYSLTAAGVTR